MVKVGIVQKSWRRTAVVSTKLYKPSTGRAEDCLTIEAGQTRHAHRLASMVAGKYKTRHDRGLL